MEYVLPNETRSYVPAVLNAMAALGNSTAQVLSATHFEQRTNNRVLYASVEMTE